jgi:hypothetical protein
MIDHQKTTCLNYITKGRGFSCEAATRLEQGRSISKASEQGSYEHSNARRAEFTPSGSTK